MAERVIGPPVLVGIGLGAADLLLAGLLGLLALLSLLILIGPVVVVLLTSFSTSAALRFPPPGLTLHWYAELLNPVSSAIHPCRRVAQPHRGDHRVVSGDGACHRGGACPRPFRRAGGADRRQPVHDPADPAWHRLRPGGADVRGLAAAAELAGADRAWPHRGHRTVRAAHRRRIHRAARSDPVRGVRLHSAPPAGSLSAASSSR